MLGLLCWACENYNQASDIIRKVKIEEVQVADTIEIKTLPGRVSEEAELNLAFRVAGPVSNIPVREGDYVREGQLVAQMDQRDYEIQLNAAVAQYEQVKAEAERIIELYNRNSVAENDYDKAVSGLKMVETKLENARQQFNDTRLLAPVSGYIQRINFRQDEIVDAGMPVVSLLDVSQYQVDVDIPLSLYKRRGDILSFSGVVSPMRKDTFDLGLLGISRKANQNQLYRMNLGLSAGNDTDLAPGMDVMVAVILRNNAELMTSVPVTALFNKAESVFVWVYDSASQTVSSREVTTGKMAGNGMIFIMSGLKQDELVVVAGVSLIKENEKVEPLDPVSETNVGGLL